MCCTIHVLDGTWPQGESVEADINISTYQHVNNVINDGDWSISPPTNLNELGLWTNKIEYLIAFQLVMTPPSLGGHNKMFYECLRPAGSLAEGERGGKERLEGSKVSCFVTAPLYAG